MHSPLTLLPSVIGLRKSRLNSLFIRQNYLSSPYFWGHWTRQGNRCVFDWRGRKASRRRNEWVSSFERLNRYDLNYWTYWLILSPEPVGNDFNPFPYLPYEWKKGTVNEDATEPIYLIRQSERLNLKEKQPEPICDPILLTLFIQSGTHLFWSSSRSLFINEFSLTYLWTVNEEESELLPLPVLVFFGESNRSEEDIFALTPNGPPWNGLFRPLLHYLPFTFWNSKLLTSPSPYTLWPTLTLQERKENELIEAEDRVQERFD